MRYAVKHLSAFVVIINNCSVPRLLFGRLFDRISDDFPSKPTLHPPPSTLHPTPYTLPLCGGGANPGVDGLVCFFRNLSTGGPPPTSGVFFRGAQPVSGFVVEGLGFRDEGCGLCPNSLLKLERLNFKFWLRFPAKLEDRLQFSYKNQLPRKNGRKITFVR